VIGPSDIEVSRLRMSREPHLRNLAELREEHLESAALRAWRGRRRLALRLWTTLLPRAIGKMRQGEGAGASREDRGGSVTALGLKLVLRRSADLGGAMVRPCSADCCGSLEKRMKTALVKGREQ